MKYSDFGFVPVVPVDGFENTFLITNQGRDVVLLAGTDRIPAVVPEVIDDEVKLVGKQRPERVIEIDCKTVPVAQNEPRAVRIAMPSQRGDGVLVEADVTPREWLGYLPHDF